MAKTGVKVENSRMKGKKDKKEELVKKNEDE